MEKKHNKQLDEMFNSAIDQHIILKVHGYKQLRHYLPRKC